MTYKRKFAQISGGTLGYITGNVPGAYLGYKLAGRLSATHPNKKQMVAIRRHGRKSRKPRRVSKWNRPQSTRIDQGKRSFRKKSNKPKKSHPDSVHVDSLHTGYSADTIRVKRAGIKRIRKGRKVIGRFMQQQNFASGFVTTEGGQSVTDFCSIGSISQLITNTPAYGITDAAACMFDLNPYRTTSGSSTFPSLLAPLSDEIFLRRAEIKLTVCCQSTLVAHVDLYLVTPKVYGNPSPAQLFAASVKDEGLNKTTMTLGTTAGTLGSESVVNVGVKPQDFARWRSMFKICAVRTMRLAPNANEDVNFDITINKMVKLGVLTQQGANLFNYVPGVTYQILVIARGAMVLDTTNNVTPTNSYGSTKVGIIGVTRFTANTVSGGAARISTNVGVSDLVGGSTAANQKIVNYGDADTGLVYAA